MDSKITHAWIFARGGSKGLPQKNILPLLGKPLIAHAIETAKKSQHINEVFVSTDSLEIAEVAKQYGATVPFLRPSSLSSDTAPERLAWRHAIEWTRECHSFPSPDIFVSLPATAPLRTVDDVDRAIELYMEGDSDTIIAVSKSNRHPAFNQVYLDSRHMASLIIRDSQGKNFTRRQDCPQAYEITTVVYVTNAEFVIKEISYMNGRVKAIVIPEEHGIDIDSMLDFKVAEFILKERTDHEKH